MGFRAQLFKISFIQIYSKSNIELSNNNRGDLLNHNNQMSFGHDNFLTEDILMLSLHWRACNIATG